MSNYWAKMFFFCVLYICILHIWTKHVPAKRGEHASAYGAKPRSAFLPSSEVPMPRCAQPLYLLICPHLFHFCETIHIQHKNINIGSRSNACVPHGLNFQTKQNCLFVNTFHFGHGLIQNLSLWVDNMTTNKLIIYVYAYTIDSNPILCICNLKS